MLGKGEKCKNDIAIYKRLYPSHFTSFDGRYALFETIFEVFNMVQSFQVLR